MRLKFREIQESRPDPSELALAPYRRYNFLHPLRHCEERPMRCKNLILLSIHCEEKTKKDEILVSCSIRIPLKNGPLFSR